MMPRSSPPPPPNDAYRRIPPEVEASFSEEQRREVQAVIRALAGRPSKKILDIRFSFWLLRRFYLVLFVGRDLRRSRRRREVGLPSRVLSVTGQIVILAVEAVILLLLAFTAAYLLKAALNIDLFPAFHLRDLFSGVPGAARIGSLPIGLPLLHPILSHRGHS